MQELNVDGAYYTQGSVRRRLAVDATKVLASAYFI